MKKLQDNFGIKPAYAGLWAKKNKIYINFEIAGEYQKDIIINLDNNKPNTRAEKWLRAFSAEKRLKFIAVGLEGFGNAQEIGERLWLNQDIVPFAHKTIGCLGASAARSLCRYARRQFSPEHRAKIAITANREVKTTPLTGLNVYKKFASKRDFNILLDLADRCRKQKLRIVFVNATAAGGGVAIMRHALIRFYRLLGVDAHWLVLKPDADVFNVTKKKIHNILQAVCPADTRLTAVDRRLYNEWSRLNAAFFKNNFKKTDAVIIDDPQPAGLIPYIKEYNRFSRIIYRSHIQIVADLIDRCRIQQHAVWKFIWKRIRQADFFVAHPIPGFVPREVDRSRLVYIPANTDPLDGLNKKLTQEQKAYYWQIFSEHLRQEGQAPLDPDRPYLIQVARFDPSKGIPDVLEAYRVLREKLAVLGFTGRRIPQLLIVGNGSIDDPEGAPIYEETRRMLSLNAYAHLAPDVKLARLPHNDQLLNTLLSDSYLAFQLSHKEGFEIKVTECLMKGKPVIAYRAGGIPLQIRHGKTGFLAAINNTDEVADKALKLLLDRKLYRKISNLARTTIDTRYLTPANAAQWLSLALGQVSHNQILKYNIRDMKARIISERVLNSSK
ncbi:MAG: glycosyltransferase [Candidatus Falkowbacteria bacterium]